MPINSRTKGASFERLIVNKINNYLESKDQETRVKRNLDQAFVKGLADIYWDNIAIECKRYGKGSSNMYKNAWWQQVVNSAGNKFIPFLIYKFNHNKIMCALPLYLLSDNEKPDWQSVYMCPLADICERLDEVVRRANGYK